MPVSTRSRKRKLNEASAIGDTIADSKDVEESQEGEETAESVDQRVICGTSGYSYSHWNNGVYYPRGYSSKQWEYYSTEFHAVELNAPFYRWQKSDTWRTWHDRAQRASLGKEDPPFTYAVKAHQYFTHWRQLTVDDTFETKFRGFVEDCRILGTHCGPLLFQFPPRFKCTETTLARLEQFGRLVRDINNDTNMNSSEQPPLRVALEFRHSSWYQPKAYKVAKEYNLCICLVHLMNKNPAKWADDMQSGFSPKLEDYQFDACDWGVYARFHGTAGQYEGGYTDRFLDEFLSKCTAAQQLFVFFNNTDSGDPPSAIRDARHICRVSK